MEKILFSFFIAFAIAYTLTPLARQIAYKIGAIDVPTDERRVHSTPMPRLGGLAIFFAFMINALIWTPLTTEFIGIFTAGTFILVFGVVDDFKRISAKYKLIVQVIAAAIVIYSGVRIEFFSFPFSSSGMVYLGMISIPVTLFWIVGITNAVNLMDGLDGLAAGLAAVASISLSIIAFLNGQTAVALLLMSLAGATLGFLPYNFNPAKIFMGDTGSLFIGFILATISIEGVIKSAATVAIIIPVLVLGVPVFDTAFAIVRRSINGKPIHVADKGHLHHKLLDLGFSQKQTVTVLYCIGVLLGGVAILISGVTQMISFVTLVIILLAMSFGTFVVLFAINRKRVKQVPK
ncbi:MAG: undecaprenyl/decaprenyl-phosphate alpha-N-acetylglucosaminyl 1-phosphate transferase [Clostridiales bacterium]|nr:undecaprenyl/decaprenyl-phosphate alpha-N-acetylglucosaminyl 1-phosphate transferase [Clostridiales bacterium]